MQKHAFAFVSPGMGTAKCHRRQLQHWDTALKEVINAQGEEKGTDTTQNQYNHHTNKQRPRTDAPPT